MGFPQGGNHCHMSSEQEQNAQPSCVFNALVWFRPELQPVIESPRIELHYRRGLLLLGALGCLDRGVILALPTLGRACPVPPESV